MRILFISPNRLRLIAPTLPLGPASIVAAVQGEHEVAVLELMFAPDPDAALKKAVAGFRPEIVAVSLRNLDNQDSRNPVTYVPEVRDLVVKVRGLSAAPVVVGGSGFSIVPLALMGYLGADFGTVGEGERSFRAFLAAYSRQAWETVPGLVWRQGEAWRENPQKLTSLAQLPPPALEYFTPRLYQEAEGSAKLPGVIPVQTRRGCPMRCIYCTTPQLEGRRTRAWEPDEIATWLRDWYEKWGLTRYYFVDSLFNYPIDYARSLCRALKDLGLPLQWNAIINPAFPDLELFRLIREAGAVMVQVGNESGSELVLRRLRKGFGLKKVELTLKLLQEVGLAFTCFLMLGGPGETRATVEESVALLLRYQPRLVNLTVGVRIYPGLALHHQALEEGMVAPGDNLLFPKFYLSPAIREWIWDYLAGVVKDNPNWIF